jgi:hypothetical protein
MSFGEAEAISSPRGTRLALRAAVSPEKESP